MAAAAHLLPFIEAPADQGPVELQRLQVNALVAGLFAETTQTMVFYNPNARDLEGQLTFPLPDGAVVCGYALDIQGSMVEGVVVAKHEARRILEAEIRKGVDPGLVEQVAGNVYRTRIYPLPARGTRTISITYVSELTVEGGSASYHLPIPQAASLDRVPLRVEVLQAPVTPTWSGPSEVSLSQAEEGWVMEGIVPGNVSADLHVVLPDLPDCFALVERSGEGETFFCASLKEPEWTAGDWHPMRLAVVWDASGSRAGQTEMELELLAHLAARWPHVEADLVILREGLENGGSFASLSALHEYLGNLVYDGATALAILDLTSPPHPSTSAWLLFTDGLDTLDPGLPRLGSLPVFPITSQAANHSTLLAHLAERTEGLFLNLLRTSPEQAAQRLVTRSSAGLGVTVLGGSDVHLVRSGGRIQALGRLTEENPWARVSGLGTDTATAELGRARPGALLARAWAGRESATLQLRGQDEEALLNLGRRYGLVTPGASLLVLESLEQYLEYDLEPPASLPQWREAFLGRRQERTDTEEQDRQRRLERVCTLWAERVAWWERDYRDTWAPPEPAPDLTRAGSLACAAPPPPSVARPGAAFAAAAPFAAAPSGADPFASAAADPFGGSADAFGGGGADPFGGGGGDPFACAAPGAAGAPEPLGAIPLQAEVLACMQEPLLECEAAPVEALEMSLDMSLDLEADAFGAPPMPCSPAPAPPFDGPAEGNAAPRAKMRAAAPRAPKISIQAWDPNTPYLELLRQAQQPYHAYLEQRPAYAGSPAFFLDCADFLLTQGLRPEGLRVLSNLLEMGLEEPALMRMYAWRLLQAGELDGAVTVLERVRRLRPEEPQSCRDLALALGDRWERGGNPGDARRAAELLYEVVLKVWDRFPEIELIALMELNRLLDKAERAGQGLVLPEIDARLRRLLDLDLRISMSWDADLTDVDLHVQEPTGEHAYYGHRLTRIGGLVSRDIRDGYGPEEYVLRRAYPGTYQVTARYFGSHQQTLTGACTVLASVFTNYGRPHEARQLLTLRLDRPNDEALVGEVSLNPGSDPPLRPS